MRRQGFLISAFKSTLVKNGGAEWLAYAQPLLICIESVGFAISHHYFFR